jgi:UDP-glucose 4-epimerase
MTERAGAGARRVAVTGGAGFIGHHLVASLVAEGREVVVIDDLSTGQPDGLPAEARFVRLDVGETDALGEVLQGVEVVAHLAAVASVERARREPRAAHAVNAGGTLSVLEAARRARVRGVVLASSAAVYGALEGAVREDAPAVPTSLYGVDKRASEGYLSVYGALYGLGAVSLRFFNVYGPGQLPGGGDAPVIARWLAAAAASRAVELQGDGEQTRDFVDVSDVTRATVAAIDLAHRGETALLNVGSGRETRLNALLEAMAALTGERLEVVRAPARAGDIRRSRADIAAAHGRLGYAPAVALPEGLARTWRFWRTRTTEEAQG